MDFRVHARVADKKVRAPFSWQTARCGPLFTDMTNEVTAGGQEVEIYFRMLANTTQIPDS